MPQPIWRSTPRRSIKHERDRRGRSAFVEGCARMLDGDDSDAGLLLALGGPAAQELIDRGIPSGQRYWLRVWAARGLFWVWGSQALPYLIEASDDEQWRVREWVAKIIGKYRIGETRPVLQRLSDDPVARVRSAARQASAELD